GIVPEKKLMRLDVVVRRLAVRVDQTRRQVDAIRLEAPAVVAAAVAHEDVAILSARRLVDDRAQLAIVIASIAYDVGRNLSDLHRRLLHGIRLNLEDVDRVALARAVAMADEDAVARDAEAASVAGGLEIAVLPVAGRLIFHRGHGENPMERLHVAEQM